MSEFLRAAVGIFAAVAPLGALPAFLDDGLRAEDRSRAVGLVCLVAFLLLACAALVGGPFLDWLDISPENFQLAAGLIMLPQALQLLWRGRTLTEAVGGLIVPMAAPLLAGPASLAAAMSYGTRFGEAEAISASAVVLLATAALLVTTEWAAGSGRPAALGLLARLNGALLAIIAIELAVDGVRSL